MHPRAVTIAPTPEPARRTQADRRARTRSALLESAARGLSRHGYANLTLEQVAADAGYTRGALYHLFANKEDLALAVVAWVRDTWYAEMREQVTPELSPVDRLVAVARGHAVFCRRDVARVVMTLRVEFSGREHPVGQAIEEVMDRMISGSARVIAAGRRNGTIPAGPPPKVLAPAIIGAVEGLMIHLPVRAPVDVLLAERLVLGMLGLPPVAASKASRP